MLPLVVGSVLPLLLLGNVAAMDSTGGDPEPTPETANADDDHLSVVAIILIIFGSVSGGLLLLLLVYRYCIAEPDLNRGPDLSRPPPGAYAGTQTGGAYPFPMTQQLGLGYGRSYTPVSQVEHHPNCEDARRRLHFLAWS